MSQWVSAVLMDENGKVFGRVGDESIGAAFRRGWKLLVEKMSVENPPALTINLSTELHIGHNFGGPMLVAREFGVLGFCATTISRFPTTTKCVCAVCGWDEAKQHTTRLSVTDPFGFRTMETDIESLVTDDDERVFCAPHPQVKVECDMCVALREKGIDPVTMQPMPNKKETK